MMLPLPRGEQVDLAGFNRLLETLGPIVLEVVTSSQTSFFTGAGQPKSHLAGTVHGSGKCYDALPRTQRVS